MKNYHYQIIQLLKLLCRAERPLSSAEIFDFLAIKPRTLRDDISRYQDDLLDDGVELCSRQGMGYHLVINDENKHNLLIIITIKNGTTPVISFMMITSHTQRIPGFRIW